MAACFCNFLQARHFSRSLLLHGKKNFRKFPLHNKRGTMQYKEARGHKPDDCMGVRRVGYDLDDEFVVVPEMIPDLIVPDLTDFQLKPYVSYRVPDVVQSEFTPKDLFNACYAKKIFTDYKNKKLDGDGNPLEPSENENLTSQEAWDKARKTGSDLYCPEPKFKTDPEPFM